MIIHTIIPWTFQAIILYFFGWPTALMYLIASVFAYLYLNLKTFSHYGLERKQKMTALTRGLKHTFLNSDHLIGRILLFELSRHSDHHFMGAKPYQILESKDDSPVLPFGYPAMLILGYFHLFLNQLCKAT